DVGDHELGRLAAGLEHAVRHLLDEGAEVERAGVAHPVRALDQHLRLREVVLRPVHAEPKRVSLEVDLTEALAAKPRPIDWSGSLPGRHADGVPEPIMPNPDRATRRRTPPAGRGRATSPPAPG